MSKLSPAAQAVLAACGCPDPDSPFRLVARGFAGAALRAATDQVFSAPRLPYDSCCDVNASPIRAELLAIAIELETQ